MTTPRLRALVGAAFACTLFAFGTGCGNDSDSGPESVFLGDRFLNIAHRGGARLAPEHTLVAYENALRVGADVIEFDLHATSDGVVVILHDATVDRTTDGTGVVRNMTYAELRALDAGYRYTRDGGATYPWRGRGLTIPTLEEALEQFADVPITVEFKQVSPSIVDQTIAMFEAHGALDNAAFASFDSRPVRRMREIAPLTPSALDAAELVGFSAFDPSMPNGYVLPAPVIQPPHVTVDAAFVAKARAVGAKVHPWTVNDPARMQELIDLGVDGIFTDDPETLAGLLR